MAVSPFRWLFLPAGAVCLALGFLGIFVPGLPATPFVLLAAWCFSRSSPKFESALVNSRLFGGLIRDWRNHRGITTRTRWISLLVVALTVAVTCLFAPVTDGLRWTVAGLAAIGATVVLRLPIILR